jgi:tryptophan halogenase
MIQKVLVLGSGSAGLIAAISLKKKLPKLEVRVVRSSDIGVIGVGEGTTVSLPTYLLDELKLGHARFYSQAEPTWKMGIRFHWGPRDYFDYPFAFQLNGQWRHFSRPCGYYSDENFHGIGIGSALMEANKAFPRSINVGGGPDFSVPFGFHIENVKLVQTLESIAQELGVSFIEGKMSGAERGPSGITALLLEDGQRLEADFFLDCSGFRSELLGRVLGEEFVDYRRSLFCDRAVVGGWERTTETILPYTIAETMEAGWAWQIEHEHHINRGYVYSSQAISDEAATEEFL